MLEQEVVAWARAVRTPSEPPAPGLPSEDMVVRTTSGGGGTTLLLSGLGVGRAITNDATEEQLAEYGLAQPSMEISLTLWDGRMVRIDVGDRRPSGSDYCVRWPGTEAVASVDHTWCQV
jgi:Domain of unknown function (DUF4340)